MKLHFLKKEEKKTENSLGHTFITTQHNKVLAKGTQNKKYECSCR